jgi:glutaminyl-peptide cyclotransferase
MLFVLKNRSVAAATGVAGAFLAAVVALSLAACRGAGREASTPALSSSPSIPTVFAYSVVASYPHDPDAFTEGLAWDNGTLYESTGLVGKSSLRRVDLNSGRVLQSRDLPPPYFGEGIAISGGRIYQLTWQSHTCFVYDQSTFEPKGQFSYPTEGWGLTSDGTRLIMSDGTRTLHFIDPATLKITGQVAVAGGPDVVGEMRLNELEYVRGEVYANVWLTNFIVKIDPTSGRVTGWCDLSGLHGSSASGKEAELNGIVYDSQGDRLFVTGKYWAALFEIKLTAR